MLHLSTRPLPFTALLLAMTVYMGVAVPGSLATLPIPAARLAQARTTVPHLAPPGLRDAGLHGAPARTVTPTH